MIDPQQKSIIRQCFEKEKKFLSENAEESKRIASVNNYLKKFNWAFIHPYLQGFNITSFEKMQKEDNGTTEAIFMVFTEHFFDLGRTAYFIDGYFKESPCLEPFCALIDQSIIMCLQRDYAGAINTLIPVIEGSIRNYLIHYQQKKQEKIMRSIDLLAMFTLIKRDLHDRSENYYNSNFKDFKNRPGYGFDENQVKVLVRCSDEYNAQWFSVIEDFFTNNLYLDTRNGVVADKLNRHSIFHGFNTDIYYSLENYIRLFNVLHFLHWVYVLAIPGQKILPNLSSGEVLYKWEAFEKIKQEADTVVQSKSSILEKYPAFDKKQFNRIYPSALQKQLCKKSLIRFTFRRQLISAFFRVQNALQKTAVKK